MLQTQLFLLFPGVHVANTQMSDQERLWSAVFVIALFVGCFGYVIYKNLTYRRLVKLTHPDRFMNESLEVQKQISEKFRSIQEAYESIVNL